MPTDNQSQCSLCSQKQTKKSNRQLVILKLLRSLEIQRKKHKRLISLPNETYFRQLLDYLMQKSQRNQNLSHNCKHNIIKHLLIKKLQISLDDLYCLFQGIYANMTKRKFQLQLIQKISKNIHQKVWSLDIVKYQQQKEKLLPTQADLFNKKPLSQKSPNKPSQSSHRCNKNLSLNQYYCDENERNKMKQQDARNRQQIHRPQLQQSGLHCNSLILNEQAQQQGIIEMMKKTQQFMSNSAMNHNQLSQHYRLASSIQNYGYGMFIDSFGKFCFGSNNINEWMG